MSTTTEQTHVLPAGAWNADPVHSDLAFSIEYMLSLIHI